MSPQRVYKHLFFAQVLALLATGLATVALALLAYSLAGDNAGVVLGIALAIKMGTSVVTAPLAAAAVHRLPRRQLLIGLDLLRAAVLVTLPFVTQVWHIYVLIIVFQAAGATFTPIVQATIPDLLTDEHDYNAALARSRMANDLEGVASPALAALLLTVTSFSGVFVACVIGLVASAALIARIALPPAGRTRRSLAEGTLHGLRTFLRLPRLRALLAFDIVAAAVTAMVTVNTVVLVQGRFGLAEGATALALVAFGAGSVLASLALPALLTRVRERPAMLAGAAIVSAGLPLGALVGGMPALMLLWFALGLGCALALVPAGLLLRRSAPTADRPYLYAAQYAIVYACLAVCYPLAGWLGSGAGLSAAFVAMGGIALAATIIAIQVWPREDTPPPAQPDDSPGFSVA